jgi:hypothetical protein
VVWVGDGGGGEVSSQGRYRVLAASKSAVQSHTDTVCDNGGNRATIGCLVRVIVGGGEVEDVQVSERGEFRSAVRQSGVVRGRGRVVVYCLYGTRPRREEL